MSEELEFVAWPKMPRLNRDVVITEKIDGTNAAIVVREDGIVYAQSRKRVITPEDDNFGFARWVKENEDELRNQLGEGRHFGEWWGSGIQRGYGLPKGEKRFSLFNTHRWTGNHADEYRCEEAPLCFVVPVLEICTAFDRVSQCLLSLSFFGSKASEGFKKPEGIVAYHSASNTCFKVTCEKDEAPKSLAETKAVG